MQRISVLLNNILRYSFLGKREKAEWFEEMNAHLLDTVEDMRSKGFSDENAVNMAIKRFGTADEIRDRLTKDMYGFRSSSIIVFVFAGFLLLLISLLGRMIPNRYKIHTRFMELLPVVIVTLTVMCLCLIFTRKRFAGIE